MNLTLLFALIPSCLCIVHALECGMSVGTSHEELKKLAHSCMNVGANDSNDGNVTNSTSTDASSTTMNPINDTNNNNNNMSSGSTTAGPRRSRRAAANSNGTTDQGNNFDNKDNQKCVVQCIFEKLEMTDSNGFPDYTKVSDSLLSKAQGRELRDFLQDSTDACFQTIKDDKSNACQVSTRLIKCLAEKGKSNCGDWPVGELPFQMNSDDDGDQNKSQNTNNSTNNSAKKTTN